MKYPLTIVSGFWLVGAKHSITNYRKWFANTLRINCPYVFFATKEIIEIIKEYRKELPTYYVELDISEFYTYRFRNTIGTQPQHCPSKELNMIWNEKCFLIRKAAKLNPFNSEFFAWIDAGISTYRNKMPSADPLPRSKLLDQVPHDKFLFTSSESPNFNPNGKGYYHYISGCFMMHISFTKTWLKIYKKYLNQLLQLGDWIYTEQVIFTLIYKDHPELFHKLDHGYGKIVELL